MITTNGMTSLAYLHKDFINDATFDRCHVLLNTASCTVDGTNGCGQAAATSTAVLISMGGFDAQRVTGIINFPSPTTAGTEDCGVLLGCFNIGKAGQEEYLQAAIVAGQARIRSNIAGSVTTLTSTAYAVAQGVNCTITFSRVGQLLTAVFHAASGPGDVTLSFTLASNSVLLTGGLMGFRSTSKAVWCRDLIAEQIG